MLDDHSEKGIIKLIQQKRTEEVGRMTDPLYCQYHRMVSHPLEKCITLEERIMRLVKDGTIILNFDDVVESNDIFCQNKGMSIIQFGSL